MNDYIELTLGLPRVSSAELFSVSINNRFDFAAAATGQQTDFILLIDEPSDAEFTEAARRTFSLLDQDEDRAVSR